MTDHSKPQPAQRLRVQRAIEMRLAGMPYSAIAERLDWADESGPRHAVEATLDRTDAALVDKFREVELARLERLTVVYWPAAVQGDRDAAAICLKISAQRCRLLGLNRPETIVVETAPDSDEFAATCAKLLSEIATYDEVDAARDRDARAAAALPALPASGAASPDRPA